MSDFIDMTGWKMSEHGVPNSQWLVIKYEGQSKWLCQCSCGNQKQQKERLYEMEVVKAVAAVVLLQTLQMKQGRDSVV